jgi:hypothetical protein
VYKQCFNLSIVNKNENLLGGWKLIEKEDMMEYQKPELTYIDDPAFDEMGEGLSAFPPGCNGKNCNKNKHKKNR